MSAAARFVGIISQLRRGSAIERTGRNTLNTGFQLMRRYRRSHFTAAAALLIGRQYAISSKLCRRWLKGCHLVSASDVEQCTSRFIWRKSAVISSWRHCACTRRSSWQFRNVFIEPCWRRNFIAKKWVSAIDYVDRLFCMTMFCAASFDAIYHLLASFNKKRQEIYFAWRLIARRFAHRIPMAARSRKQ